LNADETLDTILAAAENNRNRTCAAAQLVERGQGH
jgi:hypothetical protein